ncbi:MAG: sensor histidine kinase [Lachnospiraceae bacterium]
MVEEKIRYPLRSKLITLVAVSIVPLLCITIYLVFALLNYSKAYDKIVNTMTIANNYNLAFKEEMDESLYKLAVGYTTFDKIDEDSTLRNPYELINEARKEYQNLYQITTDSDSRLWLQSFLRNLDTLEDRVDDMRQNLDEGGQYDENMEMLDNNIYILTELIQDDIQYYIYYQAQSIENLKIQLNKEVYSFIGIIVILLVAIMTAVIFATSKILFSITRPIRELVQVTKKISKGDFSVQTQVHTTDELSSLATSINDMSGKLEVMVDQIKEDERKMRYAELRLLQEQINPHFLYNTLDTIVWLIEGNDPDKAVDVVVSLSEFFRLVLSKGKEYISIREEEMHIQSYLKIQQVRYRDILEYDIQIDPSIYHYKILKLTLQPLVENALYHGIKYKRAKGKILVTGVLEKEQIHLKVEDNGVGMTPEELEKLRSEISRPCKETEAGFGLANVNERIRMNFGPEYGMKINSEKDKGTVVDIWIPAEEMPTKTLEAGAENQKGEEV